MLAALALGILPPHTHTQRVAVYEIELSESIQLEAREIVQRAIHAASRNGPAVLIVSIGSAGGSFDAAQLIARDFETAEIPVYALVRERAWQAAALIALSADSLFMAPHSSIGAGSHDCNMVSNPPPEATVSLVEEFRSAAEERGISPDIGAAMLDPEVAIPGLVGSGECLTMGVAAALQHRVAVAEVSDIDALVARLGLGDVEISVVEPSWLGTTISVSNRNWRDARVYVVRSGARFRLGTVTSMNSVDYEIPASMLPPGSRIRVLAELIGSAHSTQTENVRVEQGLVIQWIVENVLANSSMFSFVRP